MILQGFFSGFPGFHQDFFLDSFMNSFLPDFSLGYLMDSSWDSSRYFSETPFWIPLRIFPRISLGTFPENPLCVFTDFFHNFWLICSVIPSSIAHRMSESELLRKKLFSVQLTKFRWDLLVLENFTRIQKECWRIISSTGEMI